MFITELDGRLVYANPALERLTGYSAADFQVSLEDNPVLHRDDVARVARFIDDFLESGADVSEPIETRVVDRWGQAQWHRSVVARVWFDDREALQFVTRQIDAADGTSSTLDLTSEYRALVQNAGDGITKLDAHGRFLYFNPRFLEIAGRDPAELGRSVVVDLVHPDDRAEARRFLVPGQFDIRFVNGDGAIVFVEVVVTPLRPSTEVMALLRDVTEQRRRQRELDNREKQHGLALLAGGLAHDLNGFLAVVRTNTALAETAEIEGEPVAAYLHEIRRACTKAAALCGRLLTTAGKTPVRRSRIDLGPMVEEAVSLVRPKIPSSVSIAWRSEERVFVSGDATSLQPMLMNLVANASEAIGERSGSIEIEVGSTELTGESRARLEPGGELSAGAVAYIRVRDDGVGMDASARARMFDPFFTTRSAGHGLGLSFVLGAVRAHEGAIGVESARGAGTTVTVYLPLAVTDGGERGSGSRHVVLIADDEPALRRSLSLLLEGSGFETLEAGDGLEAVDLVRRHEDIDIVLLDATMPLMGGIEAVREIRCLRPGLPIVMMSGDTHDPLVGIEMVTKPFEPEALVALLRSAVADDARS